MPRSGEPQHRLAIVNPNGAIGEITSDSQGLRL